MGLLPGRLPQLCLPTFLPAFHSYFHISDFQETVLPLDCLSAATFPSVRSPQSSELWQPGRRQPRGSTRQPPVSTVRSRASPQRCGARHPAWLPLCRSTDGTGEPLAVHSGDRVSGTRPTGLWGLLSEKLAGATPVLWGCRLLAPSAISKAPASCGEGLSSEPALRRRRRSQEGKPGWSGPRSAGGNGLTPHTGPARGRPAGPSPALSNVQEKQTGEQGARRECTAGLGARPWVAAQSHKRVAGVTQTQRDTGPQDEDASKGERFKMPKRTTAVSALP